MEKLSADWSELAEAFGNSFDEFDHYLDTETGQVLMVTEEARWQLESFYQEFAGSGEDKAFDLTAALAGSGLHDWQQQQLIVAHQIGRGFGSSYLVIPRRESRSAYQDMCDFIAASPIELWPQVVARIELSDDLADMIQGFLDQLRNLAGYG